MKPETNLFDVIIAFMYVMAVMNITHQIVSIWR